MLILARQASLDPDADTRKIECRVGDHLIVFHVLAVKPGGQVRVGIEAGPEVAISRPDSFAKNRMAAAPRHDFKGPAPSGAPPRGPSKP